MIDAIFGSFENLILFLVLVSVVGCWLYFSIRLIYYWVLAFIIDLKRTAQNDDPMFYLLIIFGVAVVVSVTVETTKKIVK